MAVFISASSAHVLTEIRPMCDTWRCAGAVKERGEAERGGQQPGGSWSGPGEGFQGAPGRGGRPRGLRSVHCTDAAPAVMYPAAELRKACANMVVLQDCVLRQHANSAARGAYNGLKHGLSRHGTYIMALLASRDCTANRNYVLLIYATLFSVRIRRTPQVSICSTGMRPCVDLFYMQTSSQTLQM